MSRAERRQRYDRWTYLIHLSRPTLAEMKELTNLNKVFKSLRSEGPSREVPIGKPQVPFARIISGGAPGLGKRR